MSTENPDASPTRPTDHPKTIGPYHIVQVIGEGGMGVVYLAEQKQPVRRTVAVKMMKVGMDTKEVIGRFEAERQALAVMNHPNIAKVLDAGTSESGRPYFVMEHVQGIPLNEYCDNNKLTTRARLQLFGPVCQAVQHAHQKGIIHRDLKPTNVLVSQQEGVATPKIIDFGIAKAIGQQLSEHTIVTLYGQAMGTPAYMSPEQAEMSGLDVDTRTDIYSLGVMLYEILVGKVPVDPFEDGGLQAFLARLVMRDVNPPTPTSRLNSLGNARAAIAQARGTDPVSLKKQLSGDLQWMVFKAMDKDRTRRYETANELARDIEHHLNDEPVTARPPTTRYRLRKFVRRNRVPFFAGVTAVLALLLGSVVATVSLIRTQQAERIARREAATATEVSDFLVGLFEVSNPGEARANTITAREILDSGAAAIDELRDEPEVQRALMRIMGQVYKNLGLFDQAEPLLEQSASLFEQMDAEAPDVARALNDLALLRHQQGEFPVAESLYVAAINVLEESGRNPVLLAAIMTNLATTYRVQARSEEAVSLLTEALELKERYLGPEDERVATTLNAMAVIERQQQNYAAAESLFTRAIEIREAALGPNHIQVARTLNSLGGVYARTDRFDAAIETYMRSLTIKEAVYGGDHPDVSNTLNNLAIVHSMSERYQDAVRLYLQALDMDERLLGPEHPSLGSRLNNLGITYRLLGRLEDSEQVFRRALAIYEEALGRDHPRVAETLDNLARTLREAGRADEAEQLAARAEAIEARRAQSNN